MKSLICGALWCVTATLLAAESGPMVDITGGRLEGRALTAPGGAVFKGIPYAASPTGERRWQPPAPVTPWNGVREAAAFGASCVQEVMDWNRQEATGNQEDCLYLNVWTPEWPVRAKKPVMFWIHGGGNTGGGASVDYFDGTALARKGVVVVTINYRLGLFGFFVHPGLAAESSHHAAGNYGLLDEVAALKWVHDNIERFGGDPANVTIFGQSAGAEDVGYLLASPLSAGLFQRAIEESGRLVGDIPLQKDAERAGEKFVAGLNVPAGSDAIKYLRSLPATQLQKAAVAARGPGGPAMGPNVDGYFLPELPMKAYAAGRRHAVPLMIGSNAQEQRGPKSEALRQAVADAYGSNGDQALAYYGLKAEGDGNTDALYGSASQQLWADARQRCGSVQEAIWHTATRSPVYAYQFDHAIAGRTATQHSAEVPYVFGDLLPGGFLGGPFTAADRKISDELQGYWVNFARSGDPNGGGLPKWPTFDPKQRAFQEFTDQGPMAKVALRRQICDLYMDTIHGELKGG